MSGHIKHHIRVADPDSPPHHATAEERANAVMAFIAAYDGKLSAVDIVLELAIALGTMAGTSFEPDVITSLGKVVRKSYALQASLQQTNGKRPN